MYTETEEEKKQFAEAMNDMYKAAMEVEAHNLRIMKAIHSVKGQTFFDDLCDLLKYNECGGGIFPHPDEIVRKKAGELAEEDFGSIQQFWVDQYENGGYTGDSYAGYIYVEIKPGKYLKAHYSM